MFKGDEKPKHSQKVETIIGPSVKVEGDFTGQGDIVVEGIVLGNLKTKGHLQVGSEAKIKADVEAQTAYIAGEVSGNLVIKVNLELTSTAKVSGDINVKSLSIEKGAQVNGKITMNEQPTTAEPNKSPLKESGKNS